MLSTKLPHIRLATAACACIAAFGLYRSDLISPTLTPRQIGDACKLPYATFHLLFTIPPLCLLYCLVAPFLTSLDWHKLYLLPVIAFIWTTPWDNELVRVKAWWYPSSCVIARVGYVPVEEYAFFILQSLITTMMTIFLTRWSVPRPAKRHLPSQLLPLVPMTLIAGGLYTLLFHLEGQGSRYYAAMIAWWASVPLTLLWWGTSRAWTSLLWTGHARSWLLCIALPTIYLCMADVFALRRGTWHISEHKSLQIFVVPQLPIEEAVFFLATNTILVSACLAFDRVVWQARQQRVSISSKEYNPPLSPTYFSLNGTTVKQVWGTFVRLDDDDAGMDRAQTATTQQQQDHSFGILSAASRSFSVAASLLPWDLRTDLGCLYAFARAMDDAIDDPSCTADESRKRIDLLRKLVHLAFQQSSGTIKQHDLIAALFATDALTLTARQQHDLQVSALAAGALRDILPVRLLHDLIDGYAIDSSPGGPHFSRFEEQADYAQSVAGSIGEMCVRVILARVGILVADSYVVERDVTRDSLISRSQQATSTRLQAPQVRMARYAPKMSLSAIESTMRDARRMGVCLQLVNIARDVYGDGRDLCRCYLVTGSHDLSGTRQYLLRLAREQEEATYTPPSLDEQEVMDLLLAPSEAMTLDALFAEKEHLLDIADAIYRTAAPSISLLPCPAAQTGMRVACAVYYKIAAVIRRRGRSACRDRVRVGRLERLWTAIKAVYLSS